MLPTALRENEHSCMIWGGNVAITTEITLISTITFSTTDKSENIINPFVMTLKK